MLSFDYWLLMFGYYLPACGRQGVCNLVIGYFIFYIIQSTQLGLLYTRQLLLTKHLYLAPLSG